MKLLAVGTTREVYEVDVDVIVKRNRYEGSRAFNCNTLEYNNYISLKDKVSCLNVAYKLKGDNSLICRKVEPFIDYIKRNNKFINTKGETSILGYMDTYMTKFRKEIYEMGYDKFRDELMKTRLDYEEWQVPSNWGVHEGKLVLIDYSR